MLAAESAFSINQHSIGHLSSFVTLYNMHCLSTCHCLHCQLSVGDSIDGYCKFGMHAVQVDMRREGRMEGEREGGMEGEREGRMNM